MHRSRKSIATLAAALAGVLGMAGVAAAAHGSSAKKTTETVHHQRRRHGTPSAGATSTTARVTTTSEAEHAQPEPGDDNGVDPVGRDAGEHAAATRAPVARAAAPADDRGGDAGDDRVGDAGDDNGVDPTSTTLAGSTTTSSIPDETSTTVASIPNGPQTFTVTGGTVTIDVEGGVLSLVSATPDAAFVVDKSEARADRVEVEFRSDNVQSRVQVRIDEGRLRVETGDH